MIRLHDVFDPQVNDDRDYALHLVEAFLVHHVIDLAVQADTMSTR